jgi:hypothetical protein
MYALAGLEVRLLSTEYLLVPELQAHPDEIAMSSL